MSKRTAIIFAIITFILGGLAAAWGTAAYHNRLINRLLIVTLTAHATTSVAELYRLRAGHTTNVIELMEMNLDGDLIGLGSLLSDPRMLNSDPSYVKSLQMVKDYRVKFPHESAYAEIDQGAAKALALIKK